MGQTVDGSLAFPGYLKGSSTVSTIYLRDFYDPTGSKGINALFVDTSATWCGACRAESGALEGTITGEWAGLGVAVVVLLIDQGVTTDMALQWQQQYGLTDADVGIDTKGTFLDPNVTTGLPLGVVIDPRTMRVVNRTDGYGGPDPVIAQLARTNKK